MKLAFTAAVTGAIVLLAMGFANMSYFERTPEALADAATGRNQVYLACVLLLACVAIAAYVYSPVAAALALMVALAAFFIGRSDPEWLPLLALLPMVPMLGAAAWSVMQAAQPDSESS